MSVVVSGSHPRSDRGKGPTLVRGCLGLTPTELLLSSLKVGRSTITRDTWDGVEGVVVTSGVPLGPEGGGGVVLTHAEGKGWPPT